MTVQRRSYTSGHFELMIDGHATSAYLKSVDGGSAKANDVQESVGPYNTRLKHVSTIDIEPFSIECGLAGAYEILTWIQSSWRRQWGRRNGQINHANFDLKRTFEHEFKNALITETTFPALDGSSKEAGYLKVKMQAEEIEQRKASGGSIQSNMGAKQKLWLTSAFRFTIDGLQGLEYANKIESFTIKQGIKKQYLGGNRFPHVEPTKIEFPNLSGTISLEYADDLLKWHKDYVMKGQQDTKAQRTGSIEFLAPNKRDVLFAINLYEMGLINLQMLSSTANQDQIKRMKFDLYVGSMDLDGKGLGME